MRVALVYIAMRLDAGLPKMHVQLARYLVERGHDVHVYGSLAESDPLLVREVRFHDVGVSTGAGPLAQPFNALRFMRRVDAMVRADDPDVVHARGVSCWRQDILHVSGLYAWEREESRAAHGRQGRARTLRDLAWPATYPMGLVRTLHERAAMKDGRLLVHAETPAVRSALMSRYGVDPGRVRLVVPGVDVRTFSPRGPTADLDLDGPVVVFCGHDFRRKGLDLLLRALARMTTRAGLAVIGGGGHLMGRWSASAREPFERLAVELGLTDRVRFLGAQANSAPFLRAADVFAHPARFDVWGLAVAEGMATGLPVVVTRATGAASLVDERCGEVLEDATDVDALAAALDRQLEPRRRHEAGLAARAKAEVVSVEHQGALVEEDMLRVLAARERPNSAAVS